MYPIELTTPIARDLTDFGFEELSSPEEVSDLLNKKKGIVLLVVNFVCGCAEPNAEQAAKMTITKVKNPIL